MIEEWVEQDLRLAGFDTKGGMAKPGDLHKISPLFDDAKAYLDGMDISHAPAKKSRGDFNFF
ncbi:hypothetical protein RHECNPAF_2480013 [Rhizobium etli CNPAF512]|nr:hypothetical protein RHECNPAF_2480013 [Rhizobium etli CNPAF512]